MRNFVRNAGGAFVEQPARSLMRARYLRDGLSLLVEYHEARADGFHGVHLITADPARGLVHRYSDARRNQRVEFSGRFDGDQYVISRVGEFATTRAPTCIARSTGKSVLTPSSSGCIAPTMVA
ncbi:MAG: hypothetical protein IPK85_27065 [Gemmatimonadetes bacterium]|nr:hypothetical protein [Gemmatimonadota bacterium]